MKLAVQNARGPRPPSPTARVLRDVGNPLPPP